MDTPKEGEVWHGALTCENVLVFVKIGTSGTTALLYAQNVKMSYDMEMVTGAILLRSDATWRWWHKADDSCPRVGFGEGVSDDDDDDSYDDEDDD